MKDKFIIKYIKNRYSVVFGNLVTPVLLHFAILCQIFEKIRLKTLLLEIFPECYTFSTFFVTVGE